MRSEGLGGLSVIQDDNVILDILGYCGYRELASLNTCSRAMYVYSMNNDLWRELYLKTFQSRLVFRKTWKDSFSGMQSHGSAQLHNPIKVRGVYSCILHRSWMCRNVDIHSQCKGFMLDNLPRRHISTLSCEEFVEQYEIPNKPVIITGIVSEWPAFKKWTPDYLSHEAMDFKFRATSVTASYPANITMSEYFQYVSQSIEEAPLYLFERNFNKISTFEADYSVPKYFANDAAHGTDLFRLLGEHRPDHKWLVVGPERSGSIFHIDPNQTNAWNGLIKGRKKWIFYPPNVLPPGISISEGGEDVTEPLSTGEWCVAFWKHHLEARQHPDPSKRPVEAVLEEGELIFVPHDWWHMVINLEATVALTHNYVSSSNLADVLYFLKYKEDLISGSCDELPAEKMYEHFVNSLKIAYPEMVSGCIRKIENKVKHRENATRSILPRKRKSTENRKSAVNSSFDAMNIKVSENFQSSEIKTVKKLYNGQYAENTAACFAFSFFDDE